MPVLPRGLKDTPEKTEYYIGFSKGVNKLQDEALVADAELTVGQNIQLVVDGILKRSGSLNYGDDSGSRVYGGTPFYTSAASNNRFIIREGGTALQYYAADGTPTNISGATMTASKRTEFAMARDALYVQNGTDSLVKVTVSGGVPVAATYTALITPVNLAVTPTFSVIAAVSSITRSSSTATLTTATAHGLTTGDYVTVSGADQSEYNVTAAVTVTSTTVFTYTVSGTPATPATGTLVLKHGGVTPYSYRVSAYNANGETLACVSVSISNGVKDLSTTNYNSLDWDNVTNAVGYVVYGRKGTAVNGVGETKLATVSVSNYNDTGTDTPSSILTPPEGNNTGGQKGSMVIYALSRLFVAGDPDNPSRLYYSAGGTQIDDFSTGNGGGWIDVSKNDGDEITAIFFFQNTIIVWKHRSVWKFSFTSAGLPQLELITTEIGCESYRTVKMVNNALWFLAKKDGRAAVYSLGNVQNYFNALRTTEQSLKISTGSHLDAANVAQLENACAFFFRNVYGLCIAQGGSSTNNLVFPFDARFNAWLGKWDNINANAFFTYQDANGNEDLYYCSETTGYVVKMFTGTDDNGTAISWKIQTKNFNQKLFDQYKIFRNPVFWFKDVSNSTITGFIINDGVFNSGTFNISALVSGISWGFDKWGTFKFGDSLGASTTSTNSDQPMEIVFNRVARSIKFELDEASSSGSFKFLGVSFRWLLLSGKPLPADNRIRLTS
jgi:hypothetical protein